MSRNVKHLSVVFVLVAVLCCGMSLAQESQTVVLKLEKLTFNISISRTAYLFHIVDQLSGWSQFCHKQPRMVCKYFDSAQNMIYFAHAEKYRILRHD